MNNRENLQHKTKQITLFWIVVVLLSSLLILFFPASLAIADAAIRAPSATGLAEAHQAANQDRQQAIWSSRIITDLCLSSIVSVERLVASGGV
jgi:hypothetical protein